MEVDEIVLAPNLEQIDVTQNLENRSDTKIKEALFRTLSRNHYDLLRMVDKKAAIILTVNSILVSFLGALRLAPEGKIEFIGTFFSVLIYFCIASMIIALLSMLPHKYLGRKFNRSAYTGSLYAGNFANLSLEEFQSEYSRITESADTIFSEVTKDLYFLGCIIKKKQHLIIGSVGTLILGLFLAGMYAFFSL